jgi:hypothetical protein
MTLRLFCQGLSLFVLLTVPVFMGAQSPADNAVSAGTGAATQQAGEQARPADAPEKVAEDQKELAKVAEDLKQLKEELTATKESLRKLRVEMVSLRGELAEVSETVAAQKRELAELLNLINKAAAGGPREGGPRRIYPPAINAAAAGAKAIELYDADKDGKLSGKELDKCPGLKAAIDKVDPDGKGEITAAMITERIKAWQRSRLGRMSLACTVLHNGKPLAGAVVRFVPEKFLGLKGDKWIGTGKTDDNGMAMISVPTSGAREDPPGVPPGFYRVEITKEGEKLPAKYNADTVFGQEIANDAAGIMEGIKFDMDY